GNGRCHASPVSLPGSVRERADRPRQRGIRRVAGAFLAADVVPAPPDAGNVPEARAVVAGARFGALPPVTTSVVTRSRWPIFTAFCDMPFQRRRSSVVTWYRRAIDPRVSPRRTVW